jgi:Holliday junction resolvase RusA-like endonuclease
MISVTIPLEPVPQGRPRFARTRFGVSARDPVKSREYKEFVAAYAHQQYTGSPLTGPLALDVIFYRPIPKGDSKRLRSQKEAGEVLPTVKPDLDNYYKAVTDCMKGIIWVDDNQITDVVMRKRYSAQPRTEITIREIEA